jgi:hypothetical protein
MSSAELGGIIASSTALLERAYQLEEDDRHFAVELQLRGSVCGIATGALQAYVRERHGLLLDRRLAVPEKAPRGINSRLLRHVGLFTEEEMIDPSYSQFFEYVGLDRTAARNDSRFTQLYPVAKVAVIEVARSDAFADLIAEHAHAIEPKVAQLREAGQRALPPVNSLVGMRLVEKEEVFRDIWNPNNYDMPFPVAEQPESFQRRVARVADRMMELEKQQ